MLLERLRNRLDGTVRLRVTCAYTERALNMMSARELRFWDLVYEDDVTFSCSLARRDVGTLTEIAERQGGHAETVFRRGVPFFLGRFRRRRTLIASLVLAAVLLFCGSHFIWAFEIEGETAYRDAYILRVLAEEGVRIGTYGLSVDSEDLRNRVLLRLPELSWIGINVRGFQAHVQVRPRIPKPTLREEAPPQNIVAARAGVVTKVAAQGGHAVVQRGETVEKGDLLISGYVDYEGSAVRMLPASGEVTARTWRTCSVTVLPTRQEKRYTGKTGHGLSLVFGTKRIKFFGGAGIAEEKYDTITERFPWHIFSFSLPVTTVWETHRFYEREEVSVSEASARAMGESILRDCLAASLPEGGKEEASGVSLRKENGHYTVTLRAECTENIAEVQEIG